MIENIQPRTMVIGGTTSGYSKTYLSHSSVIDEDVNGKVFWTTIQGGGESLPIVDSEFQLVYTVLTGLTAGSTYTVRGAFYDEMVDSELRTAKRGMSLSDYYLFSTATPPTISSITESSIQVDVGISDPVLTVVIDGDADNYLLESSPDNVEWLQIYSGSSNAPTFSISPGTYYFRVSGSIGFPVGLPEASGINTYPFPVIVEGGSSQPNPPTGLSYSIGRILATFERYDLRLSWDWDRGTEGNIREFIVKGFPDPGGTVTEDSPEWDNPSILTSAGSALDIILVDIPRDVKMYYRVESYGYDNTTNASDILTLTVTEGSEDENYEKSTGVEVTYSHIKAYTLGANEEKIQTFKVDAATGEVAIGKIGVGGTPIRVDPTTGNVYVSGAVIADDINAANFILTPLVSGDRPNIRTYNKNAYGDYNSGLYMGYNVAGNAFQMDIGNSASYIRWDGSTMSISGNVRIGSTGNTADEQQAEIDSKVQTYYQTSAPTGASSGDIWFDTNDGNKQYRYNGSAWVDVQDSAVKSPPNAIYVQKIAGFTASAFDSTSATNYVLNTTGASSVGLRSVVTQQNSLDSGIAITATWTGTIWDTSELFVNGDVLALGSIKGESISATTTILAGAGNTTAGLNGSNTGVYNGWRIWAGDDYPANAPFRVNAYGSMYATSAYLSGEVVASSGSIGGWNIDASYLWGGSINPHNSNSYSSTGITLYKEGGIRTPDFYVSSTDGSAHFKGTLEGADGTFSGTVFADRISGGLYTTFELECPEVFINNAYRWNVTVLSIDVLTSLTVPRILEMPVPMTVFCESGYIQSGFIRDYLNGVLMKSTPIVDWVATNTYDEPFDVPANWTGSITRVLEITDENANPDVTITWAASGKMRVAMYLNNTLEMGQGPSYPTTVP